MCFSVNIFHLKQCCDRQTKASTHLLVSLMWGGRGGDGGPVNLSLNGTLGPCSVQWHLKVQPWPFNCALITFMSWGRQQTTKQPIVFYELTTGTLSQPPITWDLGCPQYSPPADLPVCRAGQDQQCHSFFCKGIWLLSHVSHIGSELGPPTQLGLLRLVGVREMSREGWVAVSSQPVSGPSAQCGHLLYKGSQHFSWPVGFGGPKLGFLPSERLPAPEMLDCTQFLFQSREFCVALLGRNSWGVDLLKLNWMTLEFLAMTCNVIFWP